MSSLARAVPLLQYLLSKSGRRLGGMQDSRRRPPSSFPSVMSVTGAHRVRSSSGVVIAASPDRQGNSHQYSQASGPYWLQETIKASPYYTTDPETATVVYVYDYCIQSWATAAAFGGGFKDGIDPGLVLSNSYAQVLNSSRWKRYDGIDFVFFAPHPLMGPSNSYQTACHDLGRSNHLVVEAAQRLLCREKEARRSFLVVPLQLPIGPEQESSFRSFSVECLFEPAEPRQSRHRSPPQAHFADRSDRDAPSPPVERNISVFFRVQCAAEADMSSKDVFYGMRMRRHIADAVISGQDTHASVHCTNDVGRMPYEELLAAMQRSIFCLMPPGETASSRRLTDAVLSGCIPVFIGPPWHKMPLPNYVKCLDFTVFIVAQQPRNLYGGMDVGKWVSLKASPHQAVSNVYDPSFWFPAVNLSEVAIPVDDLAQLPEELRRLPEADIRRRQARLAEAQPLFRYRRRPEEVNWPGRVTASDVVIEEMCRAGAWVVQAAAQSRALSAAHSAVKSASPPAPLPARHIDRPRRILHKAGQYMLQAFRKSLDRLH